MSWKIEKWDTEQATPVYVDDGEIPTFIAGVTRAKSSNARIVDLYDGSRTIIIPPVHSSKEPFEAEIFEASVTNELTEKLKAYIDNTTKLRITMGNNEVIEDIYLVRLSWIYTASGIAWRKQLRLRFEEL